jgi:hypothetical protein
MIATKPTQYELASLAAVLSGGGADLVGRVESALTLWDAAGQALAPPPEKSPYAGLRTLEMLLPALRPKLRPKLKSDSLLKARFSDFLKWYVRGGANPRETITEPDHASGYINKVVIFTDKMATKMAEKLMIEYENHIPDPAHIAESFILWCDERWTKVKSQRGTAGQLGKQAAAVAKKGAGAGTNRKKPRFNLKKFNKKFKS